MIPKHEVVEIAEKAAEKRRPPYRQERFNDTVEYPRGYAIHKDFKDYFDKKAEEGEVQYHDWSTGRLRILISGILSEAGWEYRVEHREARFYEPIREAVE